MTFKRGALEQRKTIRLKYATKHYTKSNGENIPQTNYGINYLQNIVMEFSKTPYYLKTDKLNSLETGRGTKMNFFFQCHLKCLVDN